MSEEEAPPTKAPVIGGAFGGAEGMTAFCWPMGSIWKGASGISRIALTTRVTHLITPTPDEVSRTDPFLFIDAGSERKCSWISSLRVATGGGVFEEAADVMAVGRGRISG